jgi:hypothetical protein
MNDAYPSLNIGVRSPEVNSSLSSSTGGTSNPTFTGINPFPLSGVNPHAHSYGGVANVTASWQPASAVDAFLKIQFTAVEVRCAITRKMVPAGSAVMLLGGMVISAEAFEKWLEGHLSELICVRHGDLHTDAGAYEE